MSIIMLNQDIITKTWLIRINNDLKENYRKMFNIYSEDFDRLWEQYVEINYVLVKKGYPPINIPDEMDYPMETEYTLKNITDNYTAWHKKKHREFCTQMINTIKIIDDYIEEM